MLIYAIITITLALVFYSIGVWSEKLQGILKRWHVVIFWIGFIFDTIGASLMSKMSEGKFQFNLHGITGLLAILLMLFHAIWATIVIVKDNKKSVRNFHKFSILVWCEWLIPYLTGAVFGMGR